jgi:phage-related protein
VEKNFEILFLDEAFEFLKSIDKKHYEKILYNIRKAQVEHDPELFKKLRDDIWEFRTLYQGIKYRLLAFWDKSDKQETLVVSTHCFIKKQHKVPDNEIEKAKRIREQYFIDKIKDKNSKNK